MDDDWDLHAVVRACCTTTTASSSSSAASTTTNTTKTAFSADLDSFSSFPVNNNNHQQLNSFAIPLENLHELHKHPIPSSLATLSASKEKSQVLPLQQEFKRPHSFISTTANSTPSANSAPPRSKRRKNQLKRVCHVPADVLSSDIWAWRKYGQKPIKGSPYPRGYYKCSGSKGCLARKQVERNKSDPTMFIVTYTAEHNHPAPTHRNSLAGSTRQKAPPQTTTITTNEQPSCSSQANSMHEENQKIAPQSTKTESFEDIVQDEDYEPKLSKMAVNDDDFFEGLEDFACQGTEDDFSDKFPANFGVSWTATAARGS